MSVEGTPKFSSLVVKEITAEINGMSVSISAKAAFVDSRTNATHGWTKGEGAIWSENTKAQLLLLQQAIEEDLARAHFTDGVVQNAAFTRNNAPAEVGGITEHLEEADQA